MFVAMGRDVSHPIPATPVLAALAMMTGFGSHRGAWTLTGNDMFWEITAAIFVAASLQGVISHRWIEQTDGQA